MNQNLRLPPNWLRFLIIILLVLGVFFRFANLDGKVYSIEEAATSLRISGYTEQEIRQQIFNGKVISLKDLQRYQHLNPEKTLADTIKGLAIEEPQLPPLYYVMLRSWVQWFGDSITGIRSLSAVISLLVFPCLYWLCIELFGLPLVAWIAIALMAVSPFFMLYAQEARLYSLWTVIIPLTSAALLRAIRVKTIFSWVFYSLTLSLAFYTTVLSGLVAIGHGIYVVGTQGIRLSKTLSAYLIASIVGLLTFAPWIYVIVNYFYASYSATEWASLRKIPYVFVIVGFLSNIIRVFFDVPNKLLWQALPNTYQPIDVILGIISLPLFLSILFLVGYSIYFLCLKTPKRVWLFIVSLIAVNSLIFLLPDLFIGGIRAVIPRFQIPNYMCILLAVAYLLAIKISAVSNSFRQQQIGKIIMLALISCGVISCTISSQSNLWWNKYFNIDNIPIARIINQTQSPLVISDSGGSHYINILSLSHVLDPKVKFQLISKIDDSTKISSISNSFSDLFLLNPSEILRERLEKEQKFKTNLVFDGSKINPWRSDLFLWKLE